VVAVAVVIHLAAITAALILLLLALFPVEPAEEAGLLLSMAQAVAQRVIQVMAVKVALAAEHQLRGRVVEVEVVKKDSFLVKIKKVVVVVAV
jgi:hypothetical protein